MKSLVLPIGRPRSNRLHLICGGGDPGADSPDEVRDDGNGRALPDTPAQIKLDDRDGAER